MSAKEIGVSKLDVAELKDRRNRMRLPSALLDDTIDPWLILVAPIAGLVLLLAICFSISFQ